MSGTIGRPFPPPPPGDHTLEAFRAVVKDILVEVLKPLEDRLAQLEAYVHQAPDEEMDPVFVQFCNYRDKARAVTARQREEG